MLRRRAAARAGGTVHGADLSGSIGARAGIRFIPLNRAFRDAAGFEVGKEVEVLLRPADAETAALPAELDAALGDGLPARRALEGLTPFQRNQWIEFVATAKREETRRRRAALAAERLAEGWKLPR